jgi:DNA replication and repair protein RecF
MLYIDKAGAAAQMAYKEALRDRQKLLEMGTSDRQLDAYERVIAQHGARFALGRQRAAEQVTTGLLVSFRRMAPPDLECAATYHPGGSVDAENFAAELLARRQKDRFRKAATFGPHRDELLLSVSGRPARSHASQGQQRLLSLAMKLAELDCVKTATATDPLLLLDDVSSELDAARTRAVFDFLADSQSQIFVTTTRPELFSTVQMSLPDRAEFQVSNGTLQRGIR